MIVHDKSSGIIPLYNEKNGCHVLIVQHVDGGHWGFPKGHTEEGETEAETAQRELKEETGIHTVTIPDDVRFTDAYSFDEGETHHKKMVTYFLGYVSNQDVVPREGEIKSYKWVPLETAEDAITFDSTKNLLRKARDYLKVRGIF